jgi:hypothetical protein
MGEKTYPEWYYQTTPDPRYPSIDENIRELVYQLRNNGWNTTSSCGHEYEGLIIIELYDEQMGWMHNVGGPVHCLRKFLRSLGYEHFEITHREWTWHGYLVERGEIILKMLGPEWNARWE